MNVIVICSDTFRYDHLGFLKLQEVQTPNLDRLASESAVFSNFRLCSFPTVLNRIEIFSGRYTFPLFNWGPLPYEFPVLAEVLKRHGYTTALFADNLHIMKEGFGFGRGFDVIKDVPGQSHDHFQPKSAPLIDLPCPINKLEPREGNLDRYRRNAYWYQQHGTNTTETLFRSAMDWVNSPPDRFFLWLDAFDPHEPWDAPPQFRKPYPWDEQGDAVIWPRQGFANKYPGADVANMRSLYKAEVTQIDHWVGNFLSLLRRNGTLDNTAVIFCSDHGYYFGEHTFLGKLFDRHFEKPTTIYEELSHLPLLLRHPQGIAANTTIPGLAQPPDLYATILELAGVSPVPWAQGNSLVPRLHGGASPQRFAVGGCHPHKRGGVSCLSICTDEWYLVYPPKQGLEAAELYHLPTDPAQTRNVITNHRPIAQQLFDELVKWLDGLGVTRARQKQFLHATPFPRWKQFQDNLGLWRKRWAYWKNYRNYARGR